MKLSQDEEKTYNAVYTKMLSNCTTLTKSVCMRLYVRAVPDKETLEKVHTRTTCFD